MAVSADNLAKIWRLLGPAAFIAAAGLILTGLVLLLKAEEPVKLEIISASPATASASLWLDVQGAVAKPGVYELPAESRVKDALVAAGGLTDEADRDLIAKTINLASPVKDGAKLFFPKLGQSVVAGVSASSNLINLNTASATELETLEGIGPSRSQAIIAGRPYQEAGELKTRKIIPESVYLKIADRVAVF